MKKAFTFVELIIVVTILGILSTIGFSSYVGYISESRDTQRESDLGQISSALKVYKQKRGYYSFPGDYFNINYSGSTVAMQGKLNTSVRLNSLENLPYDPKNKEYYTYSITKNKQEFQIAATLENNDINIAIVNGNYKSVSKNILPTIILATDANAGTSIETQSGTIQGDINRKLFIFNKQEHNLPYTFSNPSSSYTDGTSFEDLLTEAENNNTFWQNSDYRNCVEINEGNKLLIPLTTTPFEYQIITDTGSLTNTGCTL